MKSSIVPTAEAGLTKRTPLRKIARYYKSLYDLDIHDHISVPKSQLVELYTCSATGVQFFYPHSLAGESSLYEELQRYDWYYQPWKWEHGVCSSLLSSGIRLLEVGCGPGHFLSRVCSEKDIDGVGLELNKGARLNAEFPNILDETVESHLASNNAAYDFVCSFQVLEHVCDIYGFIDACCKSLKPGGTLVLSVPNNDSLMRFDARGALNMPPHHMSLWGKASLAALQEHFPLSLQQIESEQVGEGAIPWYSTLRLAGKIGYFPALALRKLGYFGMKNLVERKIRESPANFEGHTVLAVYTKNRLSLVGLAGFSFLQKHHICDVYVVLLE